MLHPLYGGEKIDIMTPSTPDSIIFKSKGLRFLSLLVLDETYDNKNIFSLRKILKYNFYKFGYDQRIGGFGFYFGEIVFLALIFLLFKIKRKNSRDSVFFFGITTFILMVIIHPENWWARYVPYLWNVPILVYLDEDIEYGYIQKLVVIITIFYVSLNSLPIMSHNFSKSISYKKEINKLMKELKNHQNKEIKIEMYKDYFKNGFYQKIIDYKIIFKKIEFSNSIEQNNIKHNIWIVKKIHIY